MTKKLVVVIVACTAIVAATAALNLRQSGHNHGPTTQETMITS
ncbi:MAG: hypothetical protein ACFB0G_01330 [Leptolyngbyaceae cyanobacterium]